MSMNSDMVQATRLPHKGVNAILQMPWVKGKKVANITDVGLYGQIQSIIRNKEDIKEPFYVLDFAKVASLMDTWNTSLPMVKPYYAVKCNPDPAFLHAISALGGNFDCASKGEIETVLALGVSADRIVFANPCKQESHIKYAAKVGVNLTTFDSVDEVEKMQKWHPKCALLLRLKAGDENARCPLGDKYGAFPEEVTPLLQAAQKAAVTVPGVSFHVGSGARDSRAYRSAMEAAKKAFTTATQLGLPNMHILNFGGGFTSGTQFDDAAITIMSTLEIYFSDVPNLTLIAEPGRFFAETAFTLAVHIIGKRVRGEVREYWINDGLYGSMNCILYDHATLTVTPLACVSNNDNPTCCKAKTYKSTVFGPTCDGLDTIFPEYHLPELQRDDWLVFPNMGAYTAAAGSNFNGFKTSEIVTYLAYSSLLSGVIPKSLPLAKGINGNINFP